MSDLMRLTTEFEGHRLTTIKFRGRPCWIARQIGASIGYSHAGKRLPNKITGEWSDEFIAGHDYELLQGEDLAAFKALFQLGTGSVPSRTRGVVVLYEPGLHLVLAKTNKPVGRRLRRFLVDHVLPQLARDGHFDPARRVEEGQVVEGVVAAGAPLAERREERLARQAEIRAHEVDLQDRKFRVATLHRTISSLNTTGHLSQPAAASLEVSASEIALQERLDHIKPVLDHGDWVSPSAMAKLWGVSAQRVGRTISRLDLRREQPGLALSILNVAPGSGRQVVTWIYSPAAVAAIEAELVAQGHIDPDMR